VVSYTHTVLASNVCESVRSEVRSGISCEHTYVQAVCPTQHHSPGPQKSYATLSRKQREPHITSIPPSNSTGNQHHPSVPCIFNPLNYENLPSEPRCTPGVSKRSSRLVPFLLVAGGTAGIDSGVLIGRGPGVSEGCGGVIMQRASGCLERGVECVCV
jgi:hypothetical protein